MCEPKKKRLFGKQSQTQEFPRGHPRLLETSAARRSRRQGSSRCLGRGSHLFSPWISLNESHLFFSLLLFLLHLFLFCSAGCFPLVKSGALFLLPKRMKLFRARTHRRRTGVGQGKGGGGRERGAGPERRREGGRKGASGGSGCGAVGCWGAAAPRRVSRPDGRAACLPPRPAAPSVPPAPCDAAPTRATSDLRVSALLQGVLAAGPETEERGATVPEGTRRFGPCGGGGSAGGASARLSEQRGGRCGGRG